LEPFSNTALYEATGNNIEGKSMRKISIYAAALSAVMSVSAVVPAVAMPIPTQTVSKTSDVQQARVVIRYGTYRGYRGYRYYRPGYRRHVDGYWYPLAVFGPTIVVRPRGNWRWCGPRWNRHHCRYQ
jgi:hypothetical protein